MTRIHNVLRLMRISRTVSSLVRSAAFYRDALGFSIADETVLDGPAWGRLTGIPDARGRSITLRLGKQELELVAFDPPGRPCPRTSCSNDLRFQHAAIVVGDMERAYANLCRYPFAAITLHGPQQLPPNTGSVIAFKFRDPDGHPLELIHFPAGVGDAVWQRERGDFLGIDHSAISVADVPRSIDFYTRLLGMSVGSRSLNSGIEQQRLDGVRDAVVNVVALQPADGQPPHLELLGYRCPAARRVRQRTRANDVIADRLVLKVDNLPQLAAALAKDNVEFVSAGIVTLRDGRQALLVRDPSGHMLQLIE
ncbi:MAG TPA: VOC family protein [Burkholderiales bacterium]|nr:VOC family protein [Burkholderiales bacterium]